MELAQDKIDLIGRIIKNDRKYPNNEDLYEDFFNETCKRSVAIINAIESEATLETYLRRIVTTSIINVLKDSGRLRRTRSGYMSTREIVMDTTPEFDYSSVDISYSNIKIPESYSLSSTCKCSLSQIFTCCNLCTPSPYTNILSLSCHI